MVSGWQSRNGAWNMHPILISIISSILMSSKAHRLLRYGSDAIGGVVVLEPEIFPKKDTLKGNIGLSGISNGRGLGLDVNLVKVWKNGWAVKSGGNFRNWEIKVLHIII
jgi:hypothetical protein